MCRLDPSDLQGGFRNLYNDLASSEQVQQFLKEAKDYEVSVHMNEAQVIGEWTPFFPKYIFFGAFYNLREGANTL